MFRGLIFAFFVALLFPVHAQVQVLIFKTKSDSLAYLKLQTQLADASKNPTNRKALDSLLYLQMMMMKGLSFREVFSPSPGFTDYEDIIHGEDPVAITRLSISNFKEETLPDSLYRCVNLVELELVNCRIKKISSRLSGLTKLKKVSILNNNPRKRLRFQKNTVIEYLVIRGDEKNRLPSSYSRLKALKTLDLSKNKLIEFPKLGNSKTLCKVIVADNNLTLSKISGRQPAHLEELNLQRNKIKKVPDGIGRFSGLKKLVLSANQIESVNEGIGKLKHLEEISLYRNRLKQIPPSLYSVESLKTIDLYYNEIEKVNDSIRLWQNLDTLYLANNKIFSVSDQIGSLLQLKALYLHHNRISNLPASIRNLTNLETLRINNNLMVEMPSSIYELKNLKNLDISVNQMTQLDERILNFQNLKLLTIINNPWESPTKDLIPKWTVMLQARNVIVNNYSTELAGK